MTSYLIPYIDPRKIDGHEDPMLDEYTYGDVGERGKKLLEKVKKGDFLSKYTVIRENWSRMLKLNMEWRKLKELLYAMVFCQHLRIFTMI